MGEVSSPELGRKLSYPSFEGISNLCFSDYSDHLLVASWDAMVRLYDVSTNVLKGVFTHPAAVLDCCFQNQNDSCFTASIDKSVSRYDLLTGKKDLLGTHNAPVSCVQYSHTTGLVVTGSWDKTVRSWDCRIATRVGTFQQPERVCSMSLIEHLLVVATQGWNIMVYDLRHMQQPKQICISPLEGETHCVRCCPNGTGYALGSVKGHITLEFLDKSKTGRAKKYKFKPAPMDGWNMGYSVNAFAFHPIYGTFATGCSGGYVSILNGNNQKCIHKFSKYPTSVASLSFSKDGLLLAVASSYTYEEGGTPHEPDAIFVRSINEAEVKPKP